MNKRLALMLSGAALCAPGFLESAHAGAEPEAKTPEAVASQAPRRARTADDPWEPMNRNLYGAGNVLDRVIFRPLAMTYRRVLPRFVRKAAHNVVKNLNEPSVVINDVLQGRLEQAAGASFRFVANTTVGVAGIFDVAKGAGVPRHDNDFGLTLGRWNLDSGPYLYVPVAGPSSVRDLTGAGVDFLLDPVGLIDFRDSGILTASSATVGALDARVEVEPALRDLNLIAIDPYATMRSVYLQSRESKVRGGVVSVDALPDFPDMPDADPSLEPPQSVSPAGEPPADTPLSPDTPPVETPSEPEPLVAAAPVL